MKTVITGTLDFSSTNDVEVDVSDVKSLAAQFLGSIPGTAIFEGSIGDLAGNPQWFPLLGTDVDANPVDTMSAAGIFFFNVAVLDKWRVRVNSTGSGTPDYVIAKSTV